MILLAIKDLVVYKPAGVYTRKIKLITEGKFYNVIKVDNIGYYIKYDNNIEGWTVKTMFEPLEDSRDRKLKILLLL